MIWIILALSAFLRTYRITDFLGFWFDQGRDALVIWDLLHKGKMFLIGPTTGIEGIFLGPFYYYLIAPFYLLSRGNPAVPALFLGLLNVGAVYVIYLLGVRFFDKKTGLIAAFLYGFSNQFVNYNRWLANPTPLPIFAVGSLLLLLNIIHAAISWWTWPLLGLLLGLSLQIEAASAIFFLPATALILFLFRKSVKWNHKWVISGLLIFGLTLLPQIVFNFRHQNILFNSFKTFLVSDRSFRPEVTNLYAQRLSFYRETFTKILAIQPRAKDLFLVVSIMLLIISWRRLPQKTVATLLIWWATPVLALMFYHGNKGYIWEYYFTGVYPALVLLIAGSWSTISHHFTWGRWMVAGLLCLFIVENIKPHLSIYGRKLAAYISLTSIVKAVDWIYTDSANQPFNTDVYVPPVIPYAYDYVFKWRGEAVFNRFPEEKLIEKLYTIYEPDPGHQSLLDKWLARQAGIASIEKTLEIGPLTVQRRSRRDFK